MEFKSFAELAKHATLIRVESDAALHEFIRAACTVLLKGTKETFGSYQDGSGPFDNWKPLAESTKADRLRLGYTEDDPLVRSGETRDSYYEKVQGLEGGVGSDLEKALAQEIGDPIKNLPARSTVGLAFVRSEEQAFKRAGEGLSALFFYAAGRRSINYVRERL